MRQKFIAAVESGNMISVRYSLSNELLLDPRGNSYREMKAMAEERMDGLYEPLDGELPQKPIEEYTEDELMELKNDLDSNFSLERLNHYEQVASFVLSEKAKQMEQEIIDNEKPQKTTSQSTEQKTDSCERRNTSKQKCKSKKDCGISTTAVAAGVSGVAAFGLAKAAAIGTAAALAIGATATVATGALVKYIKNNDREDEEI